MQLTAFLLTICSLTVTARSVSQSITFSGNNIGLEKIFTIVEQQTGHFIFYQGELLADTKLVTINATGMPLTEFMSKIMEGQPLSYSIKNTSIIIKSKRPAEHLSTPLISPLLQTPPITVRGRIVNEKGEPVVASVSVKASKKGVTTDSYGAFEIQNVETDAILIISGISIESQEIKVEGRININIVAITRIAAEDEVVVSTSYWQTKKRLSTANISKVDSKEIENQPVTSPLSALIGRVPGLDVAPRNGVAGTAPRVVIRGNNSLRFDGGYPLYIVDGVPIDSKPLQSSGEFLIGGGSDPLSTISPSNIESVEILKDGAATAIYGSRGANGVIIVTTKKAKNSDGGTNIDVTAYTGVGRMSKTLDVLNTQQYMEMRKEALVNDGGVAGDFDFDINGVYDTTRYTDWQKELLGKSSRVSDVQVALNGGTGQITFRIGGNYHKETTIYPGDFGFQNITGNFNIRHQTVNKKFIVTLNANYGSNINKLMNNSVYVGQALSLAPNAPSLYDKDGELNWLIVPVYGGMYQWTAFSNPLANLLQTQNIKTENLITNLTLEYYITPDILFKINSGFTFLSGNEILKNPIAASSPTNIGVYSEGQSTFGTNKRHSWIIEPQLIYSKRINNHSINAVAGATIQKINTVYQSIYAQGYKSDLLLNSLLGAGTRTFTADEDNQYRYISGFARIGYNYKEKYIIDLIGRRDGSSRFGPGNRFGNFGAIGGAYIFTNENALQGNRGILSFGKIRASYATTGNDQIGDYKYLSTYSISTFPYLGMASLTPDALFNSRFAWEVTKKAEVGLELGFFGNRVTIEPSYYANRSSNQLINYQLPAITGFTSVLRNFNATVQNRGWEILLTTKNILHNQFSWTSSFNITFPKNKLLSFPGIENSSYAIDYEVGKSLSARRQYHYTGVDPQTGAYTFLDVDNSGNINSLDKIFTYNLDKEYYGGLTNNLKYRTIELSVLLQFSKQWGAKYLPAIPGFRSNQPTYVLNRWRKVGDITDVQRYNANFMLSDNFTNAQESDYIKENASFVRIKTVSFAWHLPKNIFSKMKLQQAKIVLQAQNLLTFTGYSGLDPESGNTLPPLRMVTAGFQVSF